MKWLPVPRANQGMVAQSAKMSWVKRLPIRLLQTMLSAQHTGKDNLVVSTVLLKTAQCTVEIEPSAPKSQAHCSAEVNLVSSTAQQYEEAKK